MSVIGTTPDHQEVIGVFEPESGRGGFLRSPEDGYRIRPDDVFVSSRLCQELALRYGETVSGTAVARGNSSARQLQAASQVDGIELAAHLERKPFDELTAVDPRARIRFETLGGPATMRVIDLMTPIGLGQRGLIVAPPRTGKTILLQQMADAIAKNHRDVRMIMLLIDERPEEVTHMRRSVDGEVIASSNDHDVASHVRIARLIIEKARRQVELGRHVLILLDSLTRLGRAFNAFTRGSGRIMSGGLDIRALTEPKSIFGSARNVENGGSLTIIASALIETGSRMDEVIFNEFKGTGNMEIMLNREMANRRLWPAIDLNLSGTRKEDLLLSPAELAVSHQIRRGLSGTNPVRAMEIFLEMLEKQPSNAEFVAKFDARRFRAN